MTRTWKRITAITDYIDRMMATIGGLAVIAMFGIIIYDVFMRYFFDRPTRWAVDLGELLMLPVIYLAAAMVLREDGHIRVDIIISRVHGMRRSIIELLMLILGSIWAVLLAWQGWVDFFDFSDRGRTTDSGELPMAPWVLVIGIGGGMMVLVFLIKIIERIQEIKTQWKGKGRINPTEVADGR